ncbi:MAG TPA: hypothetical protein VM737_04535 [Gemmatimonadota bacterium]|nr:hypothetical protein [Gemmatimonadota bacterium]
MRSGTRVVLLFALFAAVAFGLFRLYGQRAMDERPTDTPLSAARDFVRADNTAVGLLGGIREMRPVEMRALGRSRVALSAIVIGARGRARLDADMELEDGRWRIARAALRFPDGRRFPLAGEGSPALEPPGR